MTGPRRTFLFAPATDAPPAFACDAVAGTVANRIQVVLIPTENMAEGTVFGNAAAIRSGNRESLSLKAAHSKEVGADVIESFDDLIPVLQAVLSGQNEAADCTGDLPQERLQC